MQVLCKDIALNLPDFLHEDLILQQHKDIGLTQMIFLGKSSNWFFEQKSAQSINDFFFLSFMANRCTELYQFLHEITAW